MASWFFKVEDHYQSYVLKDKDLPVRFVRNINEGGYKKEIQIDFNQSSKMATIVDFINDNKKIVPFRVRRKIWILLFIIYVII